MNYIQFPKTIDLNVNGLCNLKCPWCWGPEHSKIIESLTINDWKKIISKLKEGGTNSLVFTGGEPLLKKGLLEILKFSKELGFRTTLSTNAILLEKKAEILKYVDDIGIPLDGSTSEKNKIMRPGKADQFKEAIKSILLIQNEYQNIDLTVRSVLSNKNKQDIRNIGQLLLDNGVKLDKIRWKIYQCNTAGPRKEETINGGWLIEYVDFIGIINELKLEFKEFKNIDFHSLKNSANNRYLHINPNGEIKVIINDNGIPIEKIIGVIDMMNFSETINNVSKILSNDYHGLLNNNTRNQ